MMAIPKEMVESTVGWGIVMQCYATLLCERIVISWNQLKYMFSIILEYTCYD